MKNEKCQKCGLNYIHQIGCPNSSLPTYVSPTTVKLEPKTENHSQTSIEPKKLNTAKRRANCCYGNHAFVLSDESLPFFEKRPDRETDAYYCGCYGWN